MSNSTSSSINLGAYQLLEPLASGGSGRVYRARGPGGQLVAVKVLLPRDQQRDPAATARFVREIQVLAALRHPNIVKLLDHGEDAALGPYLVMPLVSGKTLRELAATTKLGPEAVLLLLREILDGLTLVHGAGLVHRDLKPDNVLFSSDGRVTIVDFGLAVGDDHSRHTTAGAVAGSVPYMSPERIEGRASGPSSDVWALGVMAYELLAGKRPFQRATQSEEVAAILGGVHASLRRIDGVRVSKAFAEMLESCLAPSPADRPESATLLTSVTAQIDWVPLEQISDELGHLARDPEDHRQKLAELLGSRLRHEAEQAISCGDSFAAIERLDRALALRPDDGELLALLDRASSLVPPEGSAAPRGSEATSGGALVPPEKAPVPARGSAPAAAASSRSGRNTIVVTLAAVAVASAVALYLTQRGVPPVSERGAPAARAETSATSAPPSASAPPPSAPAALETDAGAVAPPFPELEMLPLASLSNTDPPHPPKEVAAPGELLVPARLLGVDGPAGALSSIEKQLGDKPGDPDLRIGHSLALLGNGRADEGLRELDEVGREHPKLGLFWATKAYLDLRRNRLDDAEQSFTRAIELDPKDDTARRNRGLLRRTRGRTRDAYVDLIESLRLAPNNAEALKELARLYYDSGHPRAAVPLLERVLRAQPRNAAIWIDLSIAQDNLDDSLVSVRKALALAPSMSRAHERLCSVLAKKESAEAIGACSHALTLAPGNAVVLNNRGLAYYRSGQDTKALADLDRAIAAAPDDASYRTNRYLVRTHAGMSRAAQEDLEAACRLGAQAACAELGKTSTGGAD